MSKIIITVTILLAFCELKASQPLPIYRDEFYFRQLKYANYVYEDDVANYVLWQDDEPFPPLSPRQATKLAETMAEDVWPEGSFVPSILLLDSNINNFGEYEKARDGYLKTFRDNLVGNRIWKATSINLKQESGKKWIYIVSLSPDYKVSSGIPIIVNVVVLMNGRAVRPMVASPGGNRRG
jgi:hypothetical protein